MTLTDMKVSRKSSSILAMAAHSLLLISLYAAVMQGSSTVLPNLRRYRIVTTNGRFLVPRDMLEAVIKDRTDEDSQCGNYVNLSLPQSLPSANFNETLYGELFVSYGTMEEKDLDYLPCGKKEQLETTSRSLYFAVPYLSNGNHGLLILMEMTDARDRLTPPLLTSDEYRINVDAIEEDGESVTLRVGDDVMTLDIFKDVSCGKTDEDIGDDFDDLHGKNVTTTCYPKRFDWNCGSVLDWDSGYCRVLKDNLCDIRRFDGDVCMYATTRSSIRCPSTMKITSINGVFRDLLWGLFDTLPVESFESEWIDRDHDAGIKFPCLSD